MAKKTMIRDDDDGRRRLLWVFLLLALPLAAAQSPPPPPTPPGGEPPTSAYGFNTRFNPSMAIIIVVLISAFFFMGFFSIYIRQCAGENGSVRGAGAQGGRGGRSRRAARGLDPAVIETFPTFEYSVVKNLKLGKGTLECAVCLSEFDGDETLRLLPKCSHVFHPDCIDAWLSNHTTCPVCRSNLVPGTEDDPAAEPATESAEEEAGTGTEGSRHEVAITIDESQPPTTAAAAATADQPQLSPNLIPPFQNRPPRSKSTRRPLWGGKFPRSHSTGHSLIQPGENVERFTLRLPEQVRQELVIKTKLNRTTSCAYPSEAMVSDGSVRRGLRILGGEGSSRGGRSINRSDSGAAKSDRWVFSMAPPFFTRSLSVRSPSKRGAAVKTPFDCINGAKAGADPEELPEPQRSTTPVFTVQTPP